MAEKLKMTETFDCPPEKIYGAWLSSKEHSDMTGSPAKVSIKKGGKFTAWDGYISGKNIALVRSKKIVQSWRTTDFPEDAPDSKLEIAFGKKGKGTKLTLVQTDIPDGQASQYREGWRDYYFTPMKEYFSKF